MNQRHDLRGWARVGPRLIAGDQPDGTWTLHALADPAQHEHYLAHLLAADPSRPRRKAALTLVHYAVYAVRNVVIAPLVFDGVALDVAADQLGAVVDGSTQVTACWAGRVERVNTEQPTAHAGALAMRLLEPVVETARRAGRIGARGMTNVVLDSLHSGCESFERSLGLAPGEGIAQQFLAATGHPQHRLGPILNVRPDHGPPVALRGPRTCCVLSTEPGCHACPLCPQHPDDRTRIETAHTWLTGLDDADFYSVTGRPRHKP